MEKIILLGLVLWINYAVSDGFPSKPVKKPFIQESVISKPDQNFPTADKSIRKTDNHVVNNVKCIIRDKDPN